MKTHVSEQSNNVRKANSTGKSQNRYNNVDIHSTGIEHLQNAVGNRAVMKILSKYENIDILQGKVETSHIARDLDEDEISSIGWRPEETEGPYMHASEMAGRNLQVGVGGLHKQFEDGSHLDAHSANLDFGVFGNENNNDLRIGGKADAQMFSGSTDPNYHAGVDGGVFGANAEMSAGQDGATIGAGAYAIQGAARAGDLTSKEANDEQIRSGLGLTMGAAGRAHWGDKDKDGLREYGFGFDFGPLSFDMKTEDPLMTALKNPLMGGGVLGWAADLLQDDDESTNLTRSALGLLGIEYGDKPTKKPLNRVGQSPSSSETANSGTAGQETRSIPTINEMLFEQSLDQGPPIPFVSWDAYYQSQQEEEQI